MIRTRITITVVLSLSLLGVGTHAETWQPPQGHVQLPIWPDAIAGSGSGSESVVTTTGNDIVAGKPYHWVEKVTQPTLTVYSPKEKNSGAAVVVFPGGGYQGLAIDLEGTEVCAWLTSKGITCVLLKYRVPNSGPMWDQACGCYRDTKSSPPLEDAQRTIGLVRFHAEEWHIDPRKIGVIGFSAGGHLVAAVSTHFNRRSYKEVDAADHESCRPDFAIAVYPGHLYIHRKFELNPELHVTPTTPPTFLVQADNDDVDDVKNSLVYYIALKDAGVSAEMHLFPGGGHAFGLRPTDQPITRWPALAEAWLATIGMTK